MADKVDMKRKWNWPIWVGFVIAVGGLFSYEWFAQFPVTRDFPWANLLLFGIGDVLLIVGLFRAFGRPQRYRGKVFGSVFSAIAFLLFAFFAYEIFYVLRQVPASNGAPRVGQLAPVTALQLRVAEFSATSFRIRCTRHPCRWHQRRSAGR